MRTRKWVKLFALLFALSLVAAACGSDSGDSGSEGTDEGTETEEGGTEEEGAGEEETPTTEATDAGESTDGFEVSYGIVEPSWIDSFNTQDSEGFQVARLLFDGLTDLNSDLEAIPAVAESWESADNTVWTFTLRDDVTFHNGEAVTAQSFVDAFNRVANPANASDVAYYGSAITGIQGWSEVEGEEATEVSGVVAKDDTTLEITLSSPYPLLPKAMAHPVFSPVSVTAVEEGGEGYSDQPVGNGPYMMDGAWEHDVKVRVVRNEDYYGEAGVPDAVNFMIYDSQETMYLEVQAGNLDVGDVPPEQIESGKTEFGDRFIEVDIGAYNYLGLPHRHRAVRRRAHPPALSLAIDRETISEQIFSGTRAPALGFSPPLAPGAVANNCESCQFDPERAKELVR